MVKFFSIQVALFGEKETQIHIVTDWICAYSGPELKICQHVCSVSRQIGCFLTIKMVEER